MPTALYLYNSSDMAAIGFSATLSRALAAQGWELKVDYKGAVAGSEGGAMTRVVELMQEVEAIVYAIGPLGPGPVQGTIEAEQAALAKVAQARLGRDLKLAPVLIQGGTFQQIPLILRSFATQSDNTPVGGDDALTNTLKAILGDAAPAAGAAAGAGGMAPTPLAKLEPYVADLVQRRRRGLTLFLGPYAVSDVHGSRGPGSIGYDLLKKQLPFLEMDDLLAHPWVAAGARALLEGGFDGAWSDIRTLFADPAISKPLPLHQQIADLAALWPRLRPGTEDVQARFRGLLLVTTDLDMRLEQALWDKRVHFARLRFTRPPEGQMALRAIYERPRQDSPVLRFAAVRGGDESGRDVETTTRRETTPNYEPVMVVKLLDCISNETYPPLSTIQLLTALKGAELPTPMPSHLQTAPFVMLGGGLLHPLVSFALATHFLPNFPQRGDEDTPRYIAMHSSPGPGDKLRKFEQEHMTWSRGVFGLERLTCDIPAFLKTLTYQLERALESEAQPV